MTISTRLFEEKTAREKAYQYDGCAGRSGAAWRSDVYDYFVSKCPQVGPWLDWAEQRGSVEITQDMLHQALLSGQVMTDDFDPRVLSHHIWSFLLHCLSGSARQTYKNTPRQDGLNIWRLLT